MSSEKVEIQMLLCQDTCLRQVPLGRQVMPPGDILAFAWATGRLPLFYPQRIGIRA